MPKDFQDSCVSLLVRGAYAACVVLVFSFILFEVLDIDASDFPHPASALRANVAEPPHDLKRLIPSAPSTGFGVVATGVSALATTLTRGRLGNLVASATIPAALWQSPSSLPRSSLDAPPAA